MESLIQIKAAIKSAKMTLRVSPEDPVALASLAKYEDLLANTGTEVETKASEIKIGEESDERTATEAKADAKVKAIAEAKVDAEAKAAADAKVKAAAEAKVDAEAKAAGKTKATAEKKTK
jgi:membrane protein involved in colicin uptake